MKWNNDSDIRKNIYVLSVSGMVVASFVMIMTNIPKISSFAGSLLSTLAPFIWGFFFALIVSSFASFVERHLPGFMSSKTKRLLSSIIAVLTLIALIVGFIAILLPQLLDSVYSIGVIVNAFLNNAGTWIEQSGINGVLPEDVVSFIYSYSNALIKGMWDFVQSVIPNIVSLTFATFNSVMNFLIGFIVALYILIDRDKLRRSFRNLFMAVLDTKSYERVHHTIFLSIEKFYRFFVGKVIDSVIIGILCAVAMYVLGIEYIGLISFIVGVTNIIPFFGPFIGAIPSCLLLLIVNPVHSLVFMLIILVLQQIDGNIIGPYILGDSVGLSSLWIMFAILVGGSYFGFAGMIFGVPLFAVIYVLISEFTHRRLDEKNIEVETDPDK